MSFNLTNIERETIINFNDGEDIASIYTCNKALIKRLDTYCKKRPDIYKKVEEDYLSKTYEFPKKYVAIKIPRVLSEERKKQLIEMGHRINA